MPFLPGPRQRKVTIVSQNPQEAPCAVPALLCSLSTRLRNDKGFMGATHALSALAIFLLVVAVFPAVLTTIYGKVTISALLAICINIIAGSLNNDLDNTNSTAESSLGILGSVLSFFYRSSSAIIQTTIRTSRDDSDPNPHRGLYHTIPGCAIVGGLLIAATSIPGTMTLPIVENVSYGWIAAFIVTWCSLQMAMTGLAKSTVKSIKKSKATGDLIFAAICFVLVGMLFINLTKTTNFAWVGISVAIGMVIHIFGDMFTTYGNPTLFPIPWRGKLWWRFRILPIHAGGVIENYVFIPLFSLISIASLIMITTGLL